MATVALPSTLQPDPQAKQGRRYIALWLGAFLLLSVMPSGLIVFALGVITLVLMALAIRRPVLLAVAIVLVELTIASHPSGLAGLPVNTRYAVTFMGGAVILALLPIAGRQFSLGPGARRIVLPGLAFILLTGISTASGLTPELTVQAVRTYGLAFIATLLMGMAIRTPGDFRLVAVTGIMVITLSGAAAIMQAKHPPGVPVPTLLGSGLFYGRAMGLTDSPIKASAHLMLGVVFLWGAITQIGLDRMAGRYLALVAAITTVGLYFTLTRAAVLGAGVATLLMTPLLKGRTQREAMLAFLVVIPVAAMVLLDQETRYTTDIEKDASAGTRTVLWKIALEVTKDNPGLGVGYGAFALAAPYYVDEVSLNEEALAHAYKTAEESPIHNDYLRVLVSFGVPAFIAYLALLAGIAVNSVLAYRRARAPWLRGASLGCFGATLAYMVHSMTHNQLDSTIILWLLAGLSLALVKVVADDGAPAAPRRQPSSGP